MAPKDSTPPTAWHVIAYLAAWEGTLILFQLAPDIRLPRWGVVLIGVGAIGGLSIAPLFFRREARTEDKEEREKKCPCC